MDPIFYKVTTNDTFRIVAKMSVLIIILVVVVALSLIGAPIILERRNRRKKPAMVEAYSERTISGGKSQVIYLDRAD